jgi:glucokinase
MLLAGDVGGTKTLLGLFQRAPRRPVAVATHVFVTNEFNSFTEILNAFARELKQPFTVDAAAVGVAGPVVNQTARLTNVSFHVSAAEITARFSTPQARLLNDLEAMANSVEVLDETEMAELQHGQMRTDGNAVVIAAGTGLGEAYLHRVDGRLRPVPSEGGHADFAARTDREIELLRMLRNEFSRADVEHVLSGPGLMNLYRFTHGTNKCSALAANGHDEPAAVSRAALTGECPQCVEALNMFVSAFGSEAGNLAIRGVATAGVYIGGGIAPKILPALQRGDFIEAFGSKPPMVELLTRVPVRVILNRDAGLLGAAVYANEIA